MKYDIIVIGAGSGGLNIAVFMNKAGFKTLLIDKSEKHIGGDCLNYGCVPSKSLIHVSRLVKDANESKAFGLGVKGKVNLKKVMDYVKSRQEIIRKHENAAYFREQGMDVVLGRAKFSGKNSVEVNSRKYSAKRIVLATGSRPRELKLQGIEKVDYLTNENIFNLDKLPEKLVIIGGGPIGIEIGQAFGKLGSEVIIIENGPQFLPKECREIADVLLKQLEKEGIKFYFNAQTKKFTSSNELLIEDGKKKNVKLRFDNVLVSIGRVLNIDGLDIEEAGIERDGHRLKVDDYLRTTNKNIYVCGDVAGSYQFTHVAELHAGVIINNFFSPFRKKVNYNNISWVTYTSPEIATFGLSEEALKKERTSFEKLVLDFDEDDRAIVEDATEGRLILFVSKGRIMGGSMIAMNAGELFQELVLANSSRLKLKNIFNKIYAYPTASRVNKRIISNYYSRKLTPFAKKMMKMLY